MSASQQGNRICTSRDVIFASYRLFNSGDSGKGRNGRTLLEPLEAAAPSAAVLGAAGSCCWSFSSCSDL